MSATDLLEKVRALPEAERSKFAALFHRWEQDKADVGRQHERIVEWPDIQARQRRVLGSRALPENVVLEARREERS